MAFTAEEEAALRDLLNRVDVSQTLQNLYLSDPILANNPELKLLLGGYSTTDGKDFGLTEQQLVVILAPLLGTSPPIETTFSVFAVTIQEDTLIANVAPVTGGVYDYWIDVVDSDIVPVFPINFTQGSAPTIKTFAGWAAETWRRYVYDSVTSTLTELLDVNGVSGIIVTPIDTQQTPDDVIFTDITDVAIGTIVDSNTIIIAGIVAQTTISIVDGLYSINSAAYTSADGYISNGDVIRLRQTASISNVTVSFTTVTFGLLQETWTITTVEDLILSGIQDDISSLTTRVATLEAAGGSVASTPGRLQWATIAQNLNEGSTIAVTLLRVDFGGTPSISGTSIVTSGGAEVGTYTYKVNDVAYTLGNDISWAIDDITKLFEITLVDGTISSDEDLILTTAATVNITDGDAGVLDLTVAAINEGVSADPGELNFDITAINSINESSPTVDVTILRTNGSEGIVGGTVTAFNGSATGGVDYRAVNELISFADGVVTATVTIQLFEQPIISDKAFTVILSLPTGGATLGSGTSKQVTIEWNGGLRTTGDVDWNTVDRLNNRTILPAISVPVVTTLTEDKKFFDGSGLSQDVNIIDIANSETATISNSFLYQAPKAAIKAFQTAGITFRNCYFQDSRHDAPGSSTGAYAIYLQDGKNNALTGGNEVLNCVFDDNGGDINFWEEDGAAGNRVEWNWSNGPDAGKWDVKAGNVSFFLMYQSRSMPNGAMKLLHNTVYTPGQAYGGETKDNEDMVTFQASSGVAGWQEVKYNRIFGGDTSTSSSTRFQMGDGNDANFSVFQFNTVCQHTHTVFGMNGGTNNNFSFNRVFASASEPLSSDNAVNLQMRRAANNSGPGECYDNTISYNELMAYRGPTATEPLNTIQNYWYPSVGSDGFTPNYGFCATPGDGCGSETAPTGWPGTNILGDDGHRWNGNSGQDGYDELWNRRRVVVQPTNVTGVFVENASNLCPAGDGILAWDDTANTLTFTAYGDSAGTPIDLDDTNPGTGATYATGDQFFLYSNDTDYNLEIILTGTLPTGNASDTDIAVVPPTSDGKYNYDFWRYAGLNGDFS